MSVCDMCGKSEATLAVCQPRPSDPTELCSIMYVCVSCGGVYVTTLDELIERMTERSTFAASFGLFEELEESGRMDETGMIWLSV